jgi:hypothetical protein
MLDSTFTLARRHAPHLSVMSLEQTETVLSQRELLIVGRVEHDFGKELKADISCK